MSLPKYIDLPGSGTYTAPFPLLNFNAQAFLLKANWDTLFKAVDRWLNHTGSLYRYVPLPFVVCNPCWISRVEWSGWPCDGKGWMHETDFNFALFVVGFKDLIIPDHFAVSWAYMVIDNPLTVASGREIFGYRKTFGVMDYLGGTWQPEAASTWVLKTCAPNEELQLAEVARILPPELSTNATKPATWDAIREIEKLWAENSMLAGVVKIEQIIESLKSQIIRFIQLVQLRDVENFEDAQYQALLDTPMQINRMNSARLLAPGYRIKIHDYPTYPVVSDLGIEVDENNIANSILSLQLNIDSTLIAGSVLHARGRHSLF